MATDWGADRHLSAPPSTLRRPAAFEIRIPPVCDRYVPGSGPPSQPISLLPAHDSTGYVAGKIVLPSRVSAGRRIHKKLYYIVSWSDLPAARVTIAANRVLEYVSPRALEDWEYQDLLRRDEERAQAEEIARLEKAGVLAPVEKKRRGRPPKGAFAEPIEEPLVELDAADRALLAKRQASGPSLSTPQKRRPEDFPEEYSHNDYDLAARQYGGKDEIQDSDSMDIVTSDQANDGSDAEAIVLPNARLPGVRNLSEVLKPKPGQDTRKAREAVADAPHSTSYAAQALSDESPRRLGPVAWKSISKGGTPSATTKQIKKRKLQPSWGFRPEKASKRSRESTPKSETRKMHSPWRGTSGSGIKAEASARALTPRQPSSRYNGKTAKASAAAASTTKGSVNNQTQKRQSQSQSRSVSPAAAASKKKTEMQSKRSQQGKKSKDQSKEGSGNDKDNTGKTTAAPDNNDGEEKAWNVKRLEGHRMYEVNGKPVRYFKVRWEGDWPPDQNPTWEPEDHISPGLVREYIGKRRARGGRAALLLDDKFVDVQTGNKSPKKYNSVAEVFEDVDDHVEAVPVERQGDLDRDELADELFVVTEEDSPTAGAKVTGVNGSQYPASVFGGLLPVMTGSGNAGEHSAGTAELGAMTSFDRTLARYFKTL